MSVAQDLLKNIAILVFESSDLDEATKKWPKRSKELFDAMTSRALTQAKATQLPVYHYHNDLQRGDDFGQRISNSCQDLFDEGYDYVIAIGNDCPQITTSLILEAKGHLTDGNDVIAPATDGGFNLIGLQRARFNKTLFEQLPWQTDELYAETVAYFSAFGHALSTLTTYGDIDSIADVKRILPQIRYALRSLYVIFIRVLHIAEHSHRYQHTYALASYQARPFNKGSPLS